MTDSERDLSESILVDIANVSHDVAPIIGTILAQTRTIQSTLNICGAWLTVIAALLAAILWRLW